MLRVYESLDEHIATTHATMIDSYMMIMKIGRIYDLHMYDKSHRSQLTKQKRDTPPPA